MFLIKTLSQILYKLALKVLSCFTQVFRGSKPQNRII